MQYMGAEGNSYITQKRTEANTNIYGDEYRSKRDVKETANIHHVYEEEEEEDPAKKTKPEKGGRNGNDFGRANNDRVV